VGVEILGLPALQWIATYVAHSTLLCAAAWAFDLWSRRSAAHERTLGLARERLWKLALVLPLLSTLLQCGSGVTLWQLPAELRALPEASAPLAHPIVSLLPLGRETLQHAQAQPVAWHVSWPWVAVAVWILGVLGCAFVWLREWQALGRAVRGLLPCWDPALAKDFELLRRGDPALEHVRLYVGRQVLVPLTVGWTRMRVVVPERAATELDPDERRAMLAHELAHARRRDPLWISAARVVEGVFFFQPLNRLARLKLQDEAEFLADRWAIERGIEPLSLASCLTEVAGWIVSRRALPVPSMAARGARLTRRVERLLEERRAPLPARTAPWSIAFLACALGSAAAAVPGPAARPEPLRAAAAADFAANGTPADFDLAAGAPRAKFALAESDDVPTQLALLETELDELGQLSEGYQLDPSWSRRLTDLQDKLHRLQERYPVLLELAAKAAETSEPDHDSNP
jgi:Zn-dependent protease with chaperone function